MNRKISVLYRGERWGVGESLPHDDEGPVVKNVVVVLLNEQPVGQVEAAWHGECQIS